MKKLDLYAEKQAEVCVKNGVIPAELYKEFGVKRGLRDLNGQGVLTGITNISQITAFQEKNGEKIPCDRLQIVAEDGERTLWFARKTRTLARMELPLEQTAAPTNDARVVALHAEFPTQTVSDAAPTDLAQFEFPDGANAKIQVERFLPPELAPLKRVFPNDALRGAADGAPIALGAGRFSLLYLHRGDGGADGFQAAQVFNQAASYPFPQDQIRFLSVEYGAGEEIRKFVYMSF